MTIEILAIILVVIALLFRVASWFTAPISLSPDPWGAEVDEALRDPDLPPVCHRCLTPQPSVGWFCPTCGTSVGPYNNWMPFIYVFAQGEVLRAGVTDHLRRSPLIIIGFLLYSLGSYSIFAPFYWYFLFRNLRQHDTATGDDSVQET